MKVTDSSGAVVAEFLGHARLIGGAVIEDRAGLGQEFEFLGQTQTNNREEHHGRRRLLESRKETRLGRNGKRKCWSTCRSSCATSMRRCPSIADHYDKHGFRPEQVKTLDDFAKRVPIITKTMLREDQATHPPFGRYLGCEADDIIRVHGSSGTSGKPTLYAFSRSDWDYIADVMAQGLYTCGVRRGDVVQLATVFSLFMGGWGALLGVERLGRDRLPARRRRDGTAARPDVSRRLDGSDHDADLCASHVGDCALAQLRRHEIALAARHLYRRARLFNSRHAACAGTGLGHQSARHGHHFGADALGHQRRMRGGRGDRT